VSVNFHTICLFFRFFFSEIDRDANIAKNRALFEDLGLKQAVQSLGATTAKPAAKPVQAKRVKRERAEELPAPRRQSRRLQKKLDETPEERLLREVGVSFLCVLSLLIEGLQEEESRLEQERREAEEMARIAKRPRHDVLNFKTLAEMDSPQDLSKLSTTMEDVVQCKRRVPDSDAFVFEGGGNNKKTERAVQEIREKVQNLKVVARAKVLTERIYCAAYHPEVTKDLIFFGGS